MVEAGLNRWTLLTLAVMSFASVKEMLSLWRFSKELVYGSSGGSKPDFVNTVHRTDATYFIQSSLGSMCLKNDHLQFPEVWCECYKPRRARVREGVEGEEKGGGGAPVKQDMKTEPHTHLSLHH